ncbi:MAG: imidazole glycerol phosphate synthase subunit HisH [Deltaproteobacteria bacterium]|nr:imidazole glycerol phosphate synthase subunit HisH [Deltaproteobacteria bacterium]
MIAIIDYDMGNLRSVQKAFENIGAKAVVTRDPGIIGGASHLVLPGVGAFKDCMRNLTEYGLVDPILKGIKAGKPFLGVCLGLQLLFDESTEFGIHKGLGLIKGRVTRFPSDMRPSASPRGEQGDTGLKVPHMGWNSIRKEKESALFKGVPDGAYFYFVHSYCAAPEDESVTLTTTEYGVLFTSSISRDNIMACQFHPEKSQRLGLLILKNFSMLA